MSGYVTGWVLRHSDEEGAARLVLIVLADHASSDGTNAWPSVATILRETRLRSRRTVQMALRHLEDVGAIVSSGTGEEGQTNWSVVMPEEGGAQNARGASDDAGGAQSTTGGGRNEVSRVYEPSLEPSKETVQGAQGSMLPDPVEELHAFYRSTVPGKANSQLTRETRQLIKKALDVRSIDVLRQAVSGLAASEHHREGGWTGLKYAIGKVKVSETVADRIDMMAAKAPAPGANGQTTVQVLIGRLPSEVRGMVYGWIADVEAMMRNPTHRGLVATGEGRLEELRDKARMEPVVDEGRITGWREVTR